MNAHSLKFSRHGKSEDLRSWTVPQSNSSCCYCSRNVEIFFGGVNANDCQAVIINSLFLWHRSFPGLCVSVKIEGACKVKV